MLEETIFTHLIAIFIGHKYYANIVNTRGTGITEIASFIFASQEEAGKHRAQIEKTRSFMFVETISFRSFRNYKCHKVNR